mmetsp:Transcript_34682/g.103593  ORF Transcript_34682/g.103593 Transcript_34682/m.103593 type:complete len:275 (-) Transcript_34682:204-1028(-)
MRLLCLSVALLLAPASALLRQPALLRTAPAAAPLRAAAPQMILGSKTFRKAVLSVRRSSTIKGCSPGDGSVGGGSGVGGGNGAQMSAGGDDDESNPFASAWKKYNELLDEKPLLMKAFTSFLGFAIGDILAQIFIQKQDFDWYRLFRLASFGFLVHGTSSHWFYGMLDSAIPGKGAQPVFTKVFIDQVLWNPIFGIMFFSYVACLEWKGLQYVIDKTRNELLTQVTGSWKVWPLAHAINFRFIPSSQRVLYINSIQIGYNCFLSLISNRDAEAA